MANEQNLIPNTKRSPKELRENARKGGKASGKARRKKKTVRELARTMLDMKVSSLSSKNIAKAQEIGINPDDSIEDLITIACLLNTIKKGDVDKLRSLAELLGEVGDEGSDSIEDLTALGDMLK